jgi:hypothetical protein
MKKRILLNYFALILLISCGIPEKEFNELKTENEKLKIELNECKYGSEKLLTKSKSLFNNKKLEETKSTLDILIKKYPGAKEEIEAKELLKKTITEIKRVNEKKILDEKKRLKKEKAEKEKEIRDKKRKLANATKKMRKTYDDVEGISWYRDRNSPRYNNYNGFFAYFGKRDESSPWLRLRIQYAADDWLFIEKYIIKVDGVTYTINEAKYGEIETDNGSGGIWEWLDRSVSYKEMEIIKAVANGKSVKIRFIGKQYRKDKTITSRQKLALRNVLNAYEALGGI